MKPLRQPAPPHRLGIPPVNPKVAQLSILKNQNTNKSSEDMGGPKAGFGIRALALSIDMVAVVFSANILTRGVSGLKISTDQEMISDISLAITTMLIMIIPTTLTGKSLGKKICKLKVVSLQLENSQTKIFLREFIGKSISSWLLGIGFLLALGREKLTLHDRLFKTKVIKE